jgi:RNA polymerase sigma-70 factor (ECF subfamily)
LLFVGEKIEIKQIILHISVTFSTVNRHLKMNSDIFNQSVLPLKDKLYRLALSIVKDRTEAEDIVQDVFLKIWSKQDEWELIDNVEAYCYRSIKNLSFDRLESIAARSAEKYNAEMDKDNMMFIDTKNPHSAFVEKEQIDIIFRCVEKLSENQRMVFQLREIEGMSYKDIAKSLNMSEELVKVSLFRARRKIKELLEELNK